MSYRGRLIGIGRKDSLLDLLLSPSPIFIGRLHTPQTPRLDWRRRVPAREELGGGP